jgi:hypothetical protein
VIWGEWKDPALTRCDSKRVYRSLNQAAVQAERASNRTGELIIAYTCFDCGAFHIGHADLSQQLAHLAPVDSGCRECNLPIPEAKKRRARACSSKAIYCSDRCQRVAERKRRVLRQMSIVTPP